jgi:hypothetical protein
VNNAVHVTASENAGWTLRFIFRFKRLTYRKENILFEINNHVSQHAWCVTALLGVVTGAL